MNRRKSSRVFLFILVCTLFFWIFADCASAKLGSTCTFQVSIDFPMPLGHRIIHPVFLVGFPTAKIYIDNRYVGTCAAYNPWKVCKYTAPLKPGQYTITAQRGGFKKAEVKVTCSYENENVRVPVLTLEESPSNCFPTIRVYEEISNGKKLPIRAEFYVDGLYNGKFSVKTIKFEAGRTYTFQAGVEGHVSAPYTFTCNAKERKNVNLVLTKP